MNSQLLRQILLVLRACDPLVQFENQRPWTLILKPHCDSTASALAGPTEVF